MKKASNRKLTSRQWDLIVQIIAMSILAFALGASLFMMGCSTMPAPEYSAAETYRHDLKIEVNGIEYRGIGVLKRATAYNIEVDPKGKIDRIMWQTCHRGDLEDKPDVGWSGKYKFTIFPVKHIEESEACPISITVLEEKKRRNGFALLDFEDVREEVSLVANLSCNGEVVQKNGVSICQSAVGLIQEIQFGTPVVIRNVNKPCDVMKTSDEKLYRFNVPKGQCTFNFVAQEKAKNGKRFVHRLSTIGYTDVPPVLEAK